MRLGFHLGDNWLSLLGAALTTASALTLLWFWLLEITSSRHVHAYAGILLFLILPALFVIGLLLIPLGIFFRRRKLKREGRLLAEYPEVDLRGPAIRHLLLLGGGATVLNVAILGTATYKGVEHMESSQFCGMTCHQVMQPEYTAFLDSPHSKVGCVQCHVGPGAGWFVKSKLSGVRQVVSLALDTYSRPIPVPVHDLRPAAETCQQCHWSDRPVGDKLIVRTSYGDDEKSTPSATGLVLKVGSGKDAAGIHGRHMGKVQITYWSDEKRSVIPKVAVRGKDGATVEYVSEDAMASFGDLGKAQVRTMDCLDCHNRPSHTFELPERAVDRALRDGRISRDLPFVRRKAVELLRVDYPDRATADAKIGAGFVEFYRASHPAVFEKDKAAVEAAAAVVKGIYAKNVFPAMKVAWGTYPTHIGHEDSPGCFRCHDESHVARDGKTITQDCNACHNDASPQLLADLGLAPKGLVP